MSNIQSLSGRFLGVKTTGTPATLLSPTSQQVASPSYTELMQVHD